jgi:glycosyltransferase involved in cell wall biosynthesis
VDLSGPGAPVAASPRLLIVLQDLPFFMSHRLIVAQAARAHGLDVHVAAPPDSRHEPALLAAGITFHPLRIARGWQNPLRELTVLARLWHLMRQLRPDVVHLVSIKPVTYGGLAARLAGVPGVVAAITGLGLPFSGTSLAVRLLRPVIKMLYAVAFRHPNLKVILQNHDDRAVFARMMRPDDAVMIKGCGVDLNEFRPCTERRDGPPVVIFSGRLLAEKGLVEFAEAARLLKTEGIAARFVVVGRHDDQNPTGISPGRMAQWVDAGILEYPGFSTDMGVTLRQADIACLPSYGEGMPRCLMEAAATGLPMVTTLAPGCREVVIPGQTGLLVPTRDAPALAQALRTLILDNALRQRMGAAARQQAIAEYAAEDFIAQSIAVYDAVLAQMPRKGA